MRHERRNKLTRAEWAAITSSRPVVRRMLDRGESTRPEKPAPFLAQTSPDEMSTQRQVKGPKE
jgi:hypothetical protein